MQPMSSAFWRSISCFGPASHPSFLASYHPVPDLPAILALLRTHSPQSPSLVQTPVLVPPGIPVSALPVAEGFIARRGDAQAAPERLAEMGAAFSDAENHSGNGMPGRGVGAKQYGRTRLRSRREAPRGPVPSGSHDARFGPRGWIIRKQRLGWARETAPPGLDILTGSDYFMVMDAVRIAELKARLSEYLRRVRRGRTLIVTDRETPIAQIIPYQAGPASLTIRKPMPDAPRLAAIRMPPPLAIKTDVVQLLARERGDR